MISLAKMLMVNVIVSGAITTIHTIHGSQPFALLVSGCSCPAIAAAASNLSALSRLSMFHRAVAVPKPLARLVKRLQLPWPTMRVPLSLSWCNKDRSPSSC